MTTQDVSDLKNPLGYWLRVLFNAVSNGFARRAEAKGVSVAERVVMRIPLDRPDGLQSDCRKMGMTSGAVTKLAVRRLNKGLITLASGLYDGRIQLLALTMAGGESYRLAALADENEQFYLRHLTTGERETPEGLLKKRITSAELSTAPIGLTGLTITGETRMEAHG